MRDDKEEVLSILEKSRLNTKAYTHIKDTKEKVLTLIQTQTTWS